MLKSLTFGGSLILVASAGFAQQQMQVKPLPGKVRDAGVYNVATQTWTRAGQHQNLGSKVLYSNLANTGFFGIMGVPVDLYWTDEGRVPSTTGHSGAKDDSYCVRGYQVAYCSSIVGGPQTLGVIFHNDYQACTDPNSPPANPMSQKINLLVPGGINSSACWSVTVNLKNTSLEFTMGGDNEGVFDGNTALDNFGWTIEMPDGGGNGFNGPLLNADPNNFPAGDGTYYQNPSAASSTGLDTQDLFWLSDQTGTYVNGCYWFGGYTAGNPFGSFWLVLTGDNGDCANGPPGTKYCVANNNSTGGAASISAAGSNSAGAGTLTLTSAPVPNQPSIFFHAQNTAQIPFGNGFLCATGGIVRGAVVSGVSNSASYTYDNSDAKHSLGGFANTTRNFQHWFRDPMGGGAFFNTSNAISIPIVP
jgi:hypothetical protein